MNWQRGLFRLWIVGSVIWIGYLLWEWVLVCRFGIVPPSHCQHETPWDGLAILGIGGSLAGLLLVSVLIWIGHGFRR